MTDTEVSTPLLSQVQRKMLGFALDEADAQLAMVGYDFTAAELEALASLRALTTVTPNRWQALADALNAAGALGIDLDGTITDHDEHSVVWDREAARWVVVAHDEDETTLAAEDGAR